MSVCQWLGKTVYMSFCRVIWPLLIQPSHELFWHWKDIAAPMSNKPLVLLLLLSCTYMRLGMSLGVMCRCLVNSQSGADVSMPMVMCLCLFLLLISRFHVMILKSICDKMFFNFLYSLYIIILAIYIWFFTS